MEDFITTEYNEIMLEILDNQAAFASVSGVAIPVSAPVNQTLPVVEDTVLESPAGPASGDFFSSASPSPEMDSIAPEPLIVPPIAPDFGDSGAGY